MKSYIRLVPFALAGFTVSCLAQSAFQNLDFESANLPIIASGQSGGLVPVSSALPGWSAFVGGNQVTQVYHNNETIGDPSVDILGPQWGVSSIDGEYMVEIQPGFNGSTFVGSYISQTGLVPSVAQSLQFKADTFSSFYVSLGGQNLSLVQLGSGSNYKLYGADISQFAGQMETLDVGVNAAPNNEDYFDSFVFSPTPVPEPSAFALAIIGGVSVLARIRKK